MNTITRREWRTNVRSHALDGRLLRAGCPITYAAVIDSMSDRNTALNNWVRLSLSAGVMLRTSQAEKLAQGWSLDETARVTGISAELVIYYLTKFEEDQDPGDFYGQELEVKP